MLIILTPPSSSSRSHIVAAGPCRQKQIVAAVFDQGNTVDEMVVFDQKFFKADLTLKEVQETNICAY